MKSITWIGLIGFKPQLSNLSGRALETERRASLAAFAISALAHGGNPFDWSMLQFVKFLCSQENLIFQARFEGFCGFVKDPILHFVLAGSRDSCYSIGFCWDSLGYLYPLSGLVLCKISHNCKVFASYERLGGIYSK